MKTGLIVAVAATALGLMTSCNQIIDASIATSCVTQAAKGVSSLGSQVSNALTVRESKNRAKQNNENLNALKIGQTKEEVMAIMGNADRRDTLELKKGQMVDICLYRTEPGVATTNEFDSFYITISLGGEHAPKEKYTPLIFKDDKLAGWGRSYYDQIKEKSLSLSNLFS